MCITSCNAGSIFFTILYSGALKVKKAEYDSLVVRFIFTL